MSTQVSIAGILSRIRADLDLSSQTERELLEEIEGHLEDAREQAIAQGEDPTIALQQVAARFGLEDVGAALQGVHAPWESADAIIACMVPVVGALFLRWLAFAPDGSAIGWQFLLAMPAFWVVAVVVLLIPLLQFRRWRLAFVSWGFYWSLSIIFVTLAKVQK